MNSKDTDRATDTLVRESAPKAEAITVGTKRSPLRVIVLLTLLFASLIFIAWKFGPGNGEESVGFIDSISLSAKSADSPLATGEWSWSEAVLAGTLSTSWDSSGEPVRKYENKTFGISFQIPTDMSVKETLHYDVFNPGLAVHMYGENPKSLRGLISVNPRRVGLEGYDRVLFNQKLLVDGQEEEIGTYLYDGMTPRASISAQTGFMRGETGYFAGFS